MSLTNKTVNGVIWNGAGNVARQGLQVATLIVMTRFLTPSDFGIYAILMVFVTFLNVISTMGTSQAVINLENPSQSVLSSIFYFNVVMGVFLFALLYILAWPIAHFFENQDLVHLLQIIGLSFIITTASLVQKTIMEKQMLFKKVVMLETLALMVSSVAGMVCAIEGLGVYSLLVLTLTNSAMLSFGLWYSSYWRPSLMFSIEDIKQVWGYSINLTGFSIVNYFARQSDNFLIGKYIGSSGLGIYSLAYKVMLYPLDNVSRVIVRVLFPALSEVKHDNARIKRGYLKAITFVALVTFPLMAGLFAVAGNFVQVVFGDQWSQLESLLMIMVPIGLVQSIVTTVGSIFLAKGTTNLMFKVGAFNAVATVISFIIGIPFGVEGVAIAYAIANILMLYPNLIISWNQIDLKIFEGLAVLLPFFLASFLMALGVYYFGIWLEGQLVQQLIILIAQILFGILLYTTILASLYRKQVVEIVFSLKKQ